MIQYGEIVKHDLGVKYTKVDIPGYEVAGVAYYNKDNQITNADGNIRNEEGIHIGSFRVIGVGSETRIQYDCVISKTDEVQRVALLTYEDMSKNIPTA